MRWQALHTDGEHRQNALVHLRRRTADLIRVSQVSYQRSRLQAASTDATGPIGRALRHAVVVAASVPT